MKSLLVSVQSSQKKQKQNDIRYRTNRCVQTGEVSVFWHGCYTQSGILDLYTAHDIIILETEKQKIYS